MTAVDAQALVETVREALKDEALHPDPADWGGLRRDAWLALDGLVEALGQRDEDIATLREWADRRRGAAWLGNDS